MHSDFLYLRLKCSLPRLFPFNLCCDRLPGSEYLLPLQFFFPTSFPLKALFINSSSLLDIFVFLHLLGMSVYFCISWIYVCISTSLRFMSVFLYVFGIFRYFYVCWRYLFTSTSLLDICLFLFVFEIFLYSIYLGDISVFYISWT